MVRYEPTRNYTYFREVIPTWKHLYQLNRTSVIFFSNNGMQNLDFSMSEILRIFSSKNVHKI